MKKITVIFIMGLLLVFLTACGSISELENKSIITACVAIDGENTKYGFYISLPSSSEGGEEEGSKSSAKYYEFQADNFKSAIDMFKESVSDDIDTSHLNLFAGNEAYYRNKFRNDEKYISRTIRVTALVDVCMILCNEYELFDCIGSEYDYKASDFSKSILKDYEMNLSKLSLAVHNKNYTAKIPAVCLSERGKTKLPEVCSMSYYNLSNGFEPLGDKEYELLKSKNYLKDDSSIKISINDNECIVEVKDKSACDIAAKYANKKTDILNVSYRAKKEFLYYDDYIKYFDKYGIDKVKFVGDK